MKLHAQMRYISSDRLAVKGLRGFTTLFSIVRQRIRKTSDDPGDLTTPHNFILACPRQKKEKE